MKSLATMKSQGTENLANIESRVSLNSVNTESQVMESSADTESRVMQDSGGGGGRGAGNQKKEKVLLQAKGELHGGAQGVLPRHKNPDCKRCVKESWLSKKKRKSRTIGLTVCGP
jgi:hypothetical protein